MAGAMWLWTAAEARAMPPCASAGDIEGRALGRFFMIMMKAVLMVTVSRSRDAPSSQA